MDDHLAGLRARRWWITARRVGSIERAASFVSDVGAALLFPTEKIALPSLYEVMAGPDVVPFAEWGPVEQRIWAWKDELPQRGLAWYGKLVWGRASLLAPDLLALLYPGRGGDDDHRTLDLSPEAHRLAAALAGGAIPSSGLRVEVGLDGKAGKSRYDRAMGELHRRLLVTSAGVWEGDSGWPSVMVELTSRVFDVGGRHDQTAAAGRLLDTALEVTPKDLARAFGWPIADARATLARLADDGRAVAVDGGQRYRSALAQ
ncbi:MAG: AlkZ-related protein [Acidimicrobiales bacterium]